MYKPFCLVLLVIASADVFTNRRSKNSSRFKVIAFYTERNDLAHISFVHEANKWFPKMATQYNFVYDSTNDWSKLNTDFLLAIPGCTFSGHET